MDSADTNETLSVLRAIITELPQSLEAGGTSQLSKEEICHRLSEDKGCNSSVTEAVVWLVESLLASLSLLDRSLLAEGQWRFVSFPARLVALSLLETLCDKEQQLFAADFWSTENTSDQNIDAQRRVLHLLENNRVRYHRLQQAVPIRYVYVAWAIVKINDRFLFHLREDIKERHTSAGGNYVFVGGRTTAEDLNLPHGINPIQLGKIINVAESAVMLDAAELTLHRELMEETGLDYSADHYKAKYLQSLKPFDQVEGALSNHALTRYYISLFEVKLTLDGYLSLAEKVQLSPRLHWFSKEDIINGQDGLGRTLYVRALQDNYGKDTAKLAESLDTLPSSWEENGSQVCDPNSIFELAGDLKEKHFFGVPGKLRPYEIDTTQEEYNLLTAAILHRKEISITPNPGTAIILPMGWIKLKQKNIILSARKLGEALIKINLGFLLEFHRQHYFRVSLNPENIFVSSDFFSWTVQQSHHHSSKRLFILKRSKIKTVLGDFSEDSSEEIISQDLADKLIRANSERLRDELHPEIWENYRKSPMVKANRKLGLHHLVRKQDNNIVVLCRSFARPYSETLNSN